jgi:hypothetical protein
MVDRSVKIRNIQLKLYSLSKFITTDILPFDVVITYSVCRVSLNNLIMHSCCVYFRNGVAERLDEGSQPPVRNHVLSPEDNINVVVR